ncbi:cytochrome p450 [Moniliophthora roreri MCA 2997]|uniref:Cytochrome p450 n=1 Tax=Moniliophthora roreri (strain MCA 2997) TaxID=1381753 RepID=V2WWA7_MONRO|nr:cytochrome p450 [Moniliophthora roreri MCA 2997]
MNLTTAMLPVLILIVLSVWVVYSNIRRPGKLPPGPKGYPVVGNTFQLDRARPWHTLIEWKKAYGDIVYLRLFNQNVVVLNSAKAAGDLLDRRAANYSQRPRLVVADYITGGLFFAFMNTGTLWRSMRRATHEALNVRASSRYHPIQMREVVQLAIRMLENPDNWLDHTHRFTSSGVASIIYDMRASQSSQIIPWLDEVVDAVTDASSPGRYLANHLPALELVPEFLAKWKRESKKKFHVYSEQFLRFFLSVKQTMLEKGKTAPSFSASLVESQERHGLDDTSSAWLAALLYLAGYETTSTTLGWLILAMIAFPEAQRKAQEELDAVVGRERIPAPQDMPNLPYMRAVVKEALRWRPPSPMGVFHASLEDDIYEGYYIPKGSLIIPNILAMNHDVQIYGPDPNEFKPERFLNEDGTHKPSPPDTKDEGHYTFGFGRRICPGRHVATDSLHIFAVVLWAAHLEPGKDAYGNSEKPSLEDVGSGVLERVTPFRCSSRPRFPEAKEILLMAKEEWQ